MGRMCASPNRQMPGTLLFSASRVTGPALDITASPRAKRIRFRRGRIRTARTLNIASRIGLMAGIVLRCRGDECSCQDREDSERVPGVGGSADRKPRAVRDNHAHVVDFERHSQCEPMTNRISARERPQQPDPVRTSISVMEPLCRGVRQFFLHGGRSGYVQHGGERGISPDDERGRGPERGAEPGTGSQQRRELSIGRADSEPSWLRR